MSQLNRFGIKEVADVTFYEINSLGEKGKAVLFLDTLKVSNIEFTAEQTEAKGGKGNAPLIIWDYGREVNVTLEDALMSKKTFELMYSKNVTDSDTGAFTISVGANTFPGTYYVEGTTFARDQETGKDSLFKFIIPKAKVQSESTLTMEAEGDPTVFNISLRVLRSGADGEMIRLEKKEGLDDLAKYGHYDVVPSGTVEVTTATAAIAGKEGAEGIYEWSVVSGGEFIHLEPLAKGRAMIAGVKTGTAVIRVTDRGDDNQLRNTDLTVTVA